jgi:hypothetical protein
MTTTTERDAVHEAGHVVIGRVLGVRATRVTVRADANSSGHCIVPQIDKILTEWQRRGKLRRDIRVAYRARIMVYMAGQEAETHLLGDASDGGDEDDQRWIAVMLDELLPPTPEERAALWRSLKDGNSCSDPNHRVPVYAARLRSRTHSLVVRHRGAIECVSNELLKHGRLGARAIDRLIVLTAVEIRA